ncbi:hypothetical protein [Nocardia wallacei]|uniref:hypothetical protein n=1 Tax=Nocardia wallacei TaxID=480035 RepID=UPI002453CBD5|nr:hypothetical protein [Nocardia wallacei]
MPNPEQRVLDEIDELVEESLERGIRSGEYDGHVNLTPEEPWATGSFVDNFARPAAAPGPDWQIPQPPEGFPIIRTRPTDPEGGTYLLQITMRGVTYRVDGVRIAEGDVVEVVRVGDGLPVLRVRHDEEERTYRMEVVEAEAGEDAANREPGGA